MLALLLNHALAQEPAPPNEGPPPTMTEQVLAPSCQCSTEADPQLAALLDVSTSMAEVMLRDEARRHVESLEVAYERRLTTSSSLIMSGLLGFCLGTFVLPPEGEQDVRRVVGGSAILAASTVPIVVGYGHFFADFPLGRQARQLRAELNESYTMPPGDET